MKVYMVCIQDIESIQIISLHSTKAGAEKRVFKERDNIIQECKERVNRMEEMDRRGELRNEFALKWAEESLRDAERELAGDDYREWSDCIRGTPCVRVFELQD